MIPILQTKTADIAHMGIFAVTPGPFPNFWVGPGDKASKRRGGPAKSRALCINEHSKKTNHQYNNRKHCVANIMMGLGGFS